MVQLSCPDASRWEALLADAAPDAAELEAHLAACPRCRSTLDDLAVGSSGWLRDAGRLAAETDRDPEMTKTLHRLRDALADDHSGPPIPLDFLTPADQPCTLGTLGRYQVLEVIGRGAMGIVLKALDPDLLRPVALKMMAPYLAPSGTARERFKREARAAAAVSHDHIVTIHAVEEANGMPYLVMEYISGISLQARIDRDGPLPPRDIARIGNQAARGLAMAHQQGLVHRDVKPANILLENGVERVKLTDFGLARAADDARLTQSGTAAGTPLYMSPEQAHGDSVIDPRSDLFSLGSVLYTLATGFPPFRSGTTMGVLNRIVNDPPRPIRDTIPDFPPALERIIMQLLEKNPARRYQSAAEAADRLTEFLAATPERPKARRGWLTAAALGLAAVLLIGGVVLTFQTSKGTLVVEVDDPAIKVALDGEELTITGAGPQEMRLKPGLYQVTASKDGTVVDQQVVTITRGEKVLVKVTVKPAVPPTPAVAGTTTGDTDAILDGRIKNVLPDADPDRLALMRAVWHNKNNPTRPKTLPGPPQSPTTYHMLAEAMGVAANPNAEPYRAAEALRNAYALAGSILTSTFAPKKGTAPKAEPKAAADWDGRLAALRLHFDSFPGRLGNTDAGRVVAQPARPGRDTAANNLTEPTRGQVKQLLGLRDQWPKLYSDAQESSRGLARAQNLVAGSLRQGIEQTLLAQYGKLRQLLTDMDRVAAELGAAPYLPVVYDVPAADFDARLKAIQADYDAVIARLKKSPPGKILQTITYPVDVEKATAKLSGPDRDQAGRLLSLVSHYTLLAPKAVPEVGTWEKRKIKAEQAGLRYQAGMISQLEHDSAAADLRDSERVLTTYVDTLGEIVSDLTALAAEFEAAASPEGQFKQVMAEYDALVLRLARHPVGRVLAVTDRSVTQNEIDQWVDLDDAGKKTAGRLLRLRHQLLTEKDRAEELVRNIANNRLLQSKDPTGRANDELIRSMETGLRVSTETLRGLVAELTRLADELDPPAKKAGGTADEDPRFQKVRELKSKLNEIEQYRIAIAARTDQIAQAEKQLKDLEAQRKATTDQKVAADVDRKTAETRRGIDDLKDELAELKANQAKLPPVEPLRQELDRLRKEIADSLEKKAPPKGKD